MPASLTCPGVYIQEVPSGVRTITGVATSITAFVGRASVGPTDEPVMLASFADFERRFGGIDVASPMSYAVRDFYLNGGSLALIVRVLHEDATAATIGLNDGANPSTGLVLVASSRGAWGNRLSAAVDFDTDRALQCTSPPAISDQRFNLTVRYRPRAGCDEFVIETFGSVSTKPGGARFLPLVLKRESAYVRVQGVMPGTRPPSNVTVVGSLRKVIVIKYIGETEKNLTRVFNAAEESSAMLLFDEADALSGTRSEVKDSHDRFAKINVSYLLQRMETYSGLAILTSNHRAALDTAFTRRLRFIVQFPHPEAAEREAIWRRAFPATTPTLDLAYAKLARLQVAGGHIHNIALGAAFSAAEEGVPVDMAHLLRAARADAAKRERAISEAETRGWV